MDDPEEAFQKMGESDMRTSVVNVLLSILTL
jgi:hypothetical protein